MTKAEIRREMRTRLASIGATREEKSRAIVHFLRGLPKFALSRRIALFSPLPTEPDIEGLWEKTLHHFCYPRITNGVMEFVDVPRLEMLTRSDWHAQIRELTTADARVIPPAEIEIILTPGLAFTRRGHRLGRGGGYYDRYLALLPATTFKIGICFATQVVNSLPIDGHDQHVDAVVTEDGILH